MGTETLTVITMGESQALMAQVELGYTPEELVGVENYLRYLLDFKQGRRQSNIEIVAVGDVLLDVFDRVKQVKPSREEGEEVIGSSGEVVLGGGGNVIRGLAGFAEKVHVISRIGGRNAYYGEEIVRQLERLGVDTLGVFVDYGTDTPVKTRFTDTFGRVVMTSSLQPVVLPERLEQQIIARIKQVSELEAKGRDVRIVVGDYGRGVCTTAVMAAIDEAVSANPKIACLIDPRPVSLLTDGKAGEKNAKYDVTGAMLTPNRQEAEDLTGMVITDKDSAFKCGWKILSMLPDLGSSLLLKLDGEGAVYVERGGNHIYLPPTLFEGEMVVNPSGAGDVVLAALALHPHLEDSPRRKEALQAAMWLSGASVLEADTSTLNSELIEKTLGRVKMAQRE